MSNVRRQAILIALAVLLLVLAIIVFATAKDWDLRALAAMGLIGGIAVVIVSLPENGKK
jgi:peptidoglycan/LPS O-acetylase OafA/YrhL